MTHIFTLGEAMVRLSTQPGHPLETAPLFDVHVGGAEANVAASLARLGHRVSWGSAVPDDPLGHRVLQVLRAAGVDCSPVKIVTGARQGTYFVDLREDPLPPRVIYDRKGSAASMLTVEDVPWDLVDEADVVHMSGITPALSPTCREVAVEVFDRARNGPPMVSVDINYRSKLWDAKEAGELLSGLVQGADLVVCTLEDARDLFETSRDPAAAAAEISNRFDAAQVVVTSGREGAWWNENGSEGRVEAIPVAVVDRIGAGDAFMAGVIDGVIDANLETGVRRGTALAALALSTHGDQPIFSREEMNRLLEGSGRSVDR